MDVTVDRMPLVGAFLAERRSRFLFRRVLMAPKLSCNDFHQCEKAANCHLITLKNQDNGMFGKPEEAIQLAVRL